MGRVELVGDILLSRPEAAQPPRKLRYRPESNIGSQTTCSVIADDIADDRRRTTVHQLLSGFGKWTQYALFECFLTGKELVLFQSKPAHHLVAQQDRVRFSPVYARCPGKVETVGGPLPAEERVFVL